VETLTANIKAVKEELQAITDTLGQGEKWYIIEEYLSSSRSVTYFCASD
jgi:hypothetical protein